MEKENALATGSCLLRVWVGGSIFHVLKKLDSAIAHEIVRKEVVSRDPSESRWVQTCDGFRVHIHKQCP
jgi:hypothetical protein